MTTKILKCVITVTPKYVTRMKNSFTVKNSPPPLFFAFSFDVWWIWECEWLKFKGRKLTGLKGAVLKM